MLLLTGDTPWTEDAHWTYIKRLEDVYAFKAEKGKDKKQWKESIYGGTHHVINDDETNCVQALFQ